MLRDRSDDFYGARLVADARLHLGTVINGHSSEVFFATMCKIIDRKVFLGYKAFNGKEAKMMGVKDFIFNANYGLGIKKASLSIFLANCMKAAVQDKSQGQYAKRVARWLAKENESFDFPQEFFEYLRLFDQIKQTHKYGTANYWRAMQLLARLHNQYPMSLQHVGDGRKYKTVFDCAKDFTIWEKPERLTPIKLYKHPTVVQVQELAENLSGRLDMKKRRILIASMIEIYKRDKALHEHSPADDI